MEREDQYDGRIDEGERGPRGGHDYLWRSAFSSRGENRELTPRRTVGPVWGWWTRGLTRCEYASYHLEMSVPGCRTKALRPPSDWRLPRHRRTLPGAS